MNTRNGPPARVGGRSLRNPRVRRAAAMWGIVTLSGVGILAWLISWHLARRARLIREGLPEPKPPRM